MDNMLQPQQQPKFKRFTKAEIYQAIQMSCYQNTGMMVSEMVKLEDCPSTLRHSCFNTGVAFLPQYIWQVPTEYGYTEVPYYFCPQCGKLYAYKHIYE